MRWRLLWLATALVAYTSAENYRYVNTIEHDPLEVEDNVAADGSPVTVVSEPNDDEMNTSETEEDSSHSTEETNENTDSDGTTDSSETISTVEDTEEDTSEDSVDTTTTVTESTPDHTNDDDDAVTSPGSDCADNDDNGGDGSDDNEGDGNDDNGGDGNDDNGGDGNDDNGGDDNGGDGNDDNNENDGGDGNPGDDGDDQDDNDDPTRDEDLIVETKSGDVQGFRWQDNENIISYIDIPYGAIDNLFQPATAATAWESIHSIKDHNKRCPQLQEDIYVGDIDCLTLSIFKPLNAKDASVLFHIHADNFDSGSGDPSIYGPDYLVVNEIILVLPNYRLGPLGFLCMQNETAPGNMALKDLSLALNWVSDNIEAFGGDPENIAVSGDGKSGALAGLLALSPMSRNYVNKVIAESGSFLSYWALDREPLDTAAELLDRIIETENAQSRTDVSLQDQTAEVIVSAAKNLQFRPCLETDNNTAFMTETPYNMIKRETIENISFLIGSAKYAGVHEALLQNEDSIQRFNDDSTLLLPVDLKFKTMTLKTQAGQRIKTQYFGEENISLDDFEELCLYFTDSGYLGPGIRSARKLVQSGATVFFYEFAFVGEMNRVLASVDPPVEGAVRGDIVGYLFTQDGVVPNDQQTNEYKMIEILTQMWTTFLKTGVPSTESIEWNKLENEDHSEEEWMLIDSEPAMNEGLHLDRLKLWTEIYEEHFIDNYGHELSPSVYTVLILQCIFWISFYCNASHLY